MSDSETGGITGRKDKDYNLIWFTEACLSNAARLETDIQDAERDGDTQLAEPGSAAGIRAAAAAAGRDGVPSGAPARGR